MYVRWIYHGWVHSLMRSGVSQAPHFLEDLESSTQEQGRGHKIRVRRVTCDGIRDRHTLHLEMPLASTSRTQKSAKATRSHPRRVQGRIDPDESDDVEQAENDDMEPEPTQGKNESVSIRVLLPSPYQFQFRLLLRVEWYSGPFPKSQ